VRRLTLLLTAVVSMVGCASLDLTAEIAGARPARMAQSHGRHAAVRASAHSRREASPRHQAHAGAGVPHRSTPVSQRSAPAAAVKSKRGRAQVLSSSVASARDRAATIAAVLATSCENTGLAPEPGNLDLIRAAVLCLINRERAQNGESPLRLSGQLQQAAEGHSRELVSSNYFAHVSPSGETPVDRIRETGYIPGPTVGYVIGENLAWGTYGLATPAAIVAAWIASPGHLANILEAQYSETGIGVTPAVPASFGNGAPGATYAQEFGVIVH
jgi:uncharacterized protein YkwD